MTRKTATATAALALGGLIIGLGPSAAAAQEYPVYDGDLTVSEGTADGTLAPRETIVISGGGYEPGATVTVTLVPAGGGAGYTLTTTTADSLGRISVSATVPSEAPSGSYSLVASGNALGGGQLALQNAVQVGSQGSGTTTTQALTSTTQRVGNTSTTVRTNTLAVTGSETAAVAGAGAAIAAAGAGILAYRKRSLAAD